MVFGARSWCLAAWRLTNLFGRLLTRASDATGSGDVRNRIRWEIHQWLDLQSTPAAVVSGPVASILYTEERARIAGTGVEC